MGNNKKKIGILNKGRNNGFIDNRFFGLDVGIQDEGENTSASGNKFDELGFSEVRWWEKTCVQIIFILGAVAGIVGLISAFL